MSYDNKVEYLLNMVKDETVPAIGCTEPVAVAFAAAYAKKYLNDEIDRMDILVSKNIYKNGKSVIIPNTIEWGLDLAAALGVIGGNPDDELMILRNVDLELIDKAHNMIDEGRITVNYLENSPDVYVEIILSNNKEKVELILNGKHNHIEKVVYNGEIVYENPLNEEIASSNSILKELSFKEIRRIAEEINIEDIRFIEDGIIMNKNAAEDGLAGGKGLKIGSALYKLQKEGKINADSSMRARILTAASADARMGGSDCPIMTSAGSGNQGLGVVLPIMVVAEDNEIHRDKLIRGVFFAHIINKYVKMYTGKLSAMCGCAIAAGIGSSSAITWILGGNDEQIAGAATNMLSNLTGMICDGAKENCALKLSSSAGEAVLSAFLALENVIVKPNIGIVGNNIEETIKNVGTLCKEGLIQANDVIVGIIQ
ncbi:L-serine ammonia-lyase, iron-sulfur-dependent, subunit alpha [Tissierella sp.]|uniref:L-cysteine desulfidase family protein n=1 Tax=Tissierella sp. TaxID=41274 RepID=UPI0028616CF7|nr:L-serine ammonia-lyase, iron-sulfur-dependent, subunit alpha [Tissierella sp.]MDR7855597.1 L-serine ammonia-lyase, iron-sulfur-dependent, subunit alpha [Tissierella sp.]